MSAESASPNPYRVLYVNGLERTHVGLPEKALSHYMGHRGIQVTHASVDHHSDQTAEELRGALKTQAKIELERHGRLAIAAASMGVPLSVSVFGELRREDPEADLTLLGFSGWTRVFDLDMLRHTTLNRPGKKPSPSCVDAVIHCEEVAAPLLSEKDKVERMRFFFSRADKTVPEQAIGLDGVPQEEIAGGHLGSIVRAVLKTPQTLNEMYAQLTR